MGDYLSRQYAGTDSTISRVTRDGKEGFVGKLDHKAKVAQRYLMNVLVDNPMQTTLDVLLCKHLDTGNSSEMQAYVDTCLSELVSVYSNFEQTKILNVNLNLNSKPLTMMQFNQWLKQVASLEDIIIVSCQNMPVSSYFGASSKDATKVSEAVMEVLHTHYFDKFQLIKSQLCSSQLTLFIVSKDKLPSLSDIVTCYSTAGMFGTELAASARFNIHDTSLCFANVNVSQSGAGDTIQQLAEAAFK